MQSYVCSKISPLSSGMLIVLISQAKNQWTEIYVCKVNKIKATCVVNVNLQFSYLLLTWLFLWAEIRFSPKKTFLFLGNYQLSEHMCVLFLKHCHIPCTLSLIHLHKVIKISADKEKSKWSITSHKWSACMFNNRMEYYFVS